MAWIRVSREGLVLEEIAPGLKPADVQAATEAKLHISPTLTVMREIPQHVNKQ
jgi:3-oxoacid CoA-transferase subunit B